MFPEASSEQLAQQEKHQTTSKAGAGEFMWLGFLKPAVEPEHKAMAGDWTVV